MNVIDDKNSQLRVAQLLLECDNLYCQNEDCKMHKNDMSKLVVEQIILDSIFSQGKIGPSCDFISPFMKNYTLLTVLSRLPNYYYEMKTNNSLDMIVPIIPKCFENYIYFSHIFMKGIYPLSSIDLMFDIESISAIFLLQDLENPNVLMQFCSNFETLMNEVLRIPYSSIMKVRSLILYFAFVTLCEKAYEQFFRIVQTVLKFNDKEMELFVNSLELYPELIPIIASTTNRVIRNRIKAVKPINPYDPFIQSGASLIEILARVNSCLPTPNPQQVFYCDSFKLILDPRCEAAMLHRNVSSYLAFPSIIPWEIKRQIMFEERVYLMHSKGKIFGKDKLDIKVKRKSILNDTIQFIDKFDQDRSFFPTNVKFIGEIGEDNGGLSTEFFQLFFNNALDPEFQMFRIFDDSFFWFSDTYYGNEEDYLIIGKMMGLSFINGKVIPTRFPRILFKKLLGERTTIEDIKDLYPEHVKTYYSILSGDINVEDLALVFAVDIEEIGDQRRTVDLIPGGSNIIVTDENYNEYFEILFDYYSNKSIESRFEQLKKGFLSFSQLKSFSMFSYQEIMCVLCGDVKFDWDKFKSSVLYVNYTENSQTIKNFWLNFKNLDEKMKIELYFFMTGLKSPPAGGYESKRVTFISDSNTSRLPVAHTCNLTFILPDYRDFNRISQIVTILIENNQGFNLI